MNRIIKTISRMPPMVYQIQEGMAEDYHIVERRDKATQARPVARHGHGVRCARFDLRPARVTSSGPTLAHATPVGRPLL
ncbi:MAG: hypothetical protein ACYS0G_04120 [Planctomycetota bacterium]|jgi:hypothetical protein